MGYEVLYGVQQTPPFQGGHCRVSEPTLLTNGIYYLYHTTKKFHWKKVFPSPANFALQKSFSGLNFLPCSKGHDRLYVFIYTGQKVCIIKNLAHEMLAKIFLLYNTTTHIHVHVV